MTDDPRTERCCWDASASGCPFHGPTPPAEPAEPDTCGAVHLGAKFNGRNYYCSQPKGHGPVYFAPSWYDHASTDEGHPPAYWGHDMPIPAPLPTEAEDAETLTKIVDDARGQWVTLHLSADEMGSYIARAVLAAGYLSPAEVEHVKAERDDLAEKVRARAQQEITDSRLMQDQFAEEDNGYGLAAQQLREGVWQDVLALLPSSPGGEDR